MPAAPESRLGAAPRRPILWVYGLITIALVVFAHVLALAMAGGLCYLALVLLGSGNATYIVLSLGALTCAASILWSVMPRPDRFTPPGPAIDPADQPRLVREISEIAREFREPMPSAIYLMMDPNAWVARRGGMLGFGSRRVMALGLPLLSVLTVSELRAVIAHEFAHYYGGDTSFGPWTQKAREALAGSLRRLSADSGFLHSLSRWAYIAVLRLIVIYTFGLYWKLFLRLTLLVSRQWEYRADELASAVAGAKPLVDALRKISRAAIAWPPFWTSEAAPALEAGFLPPFADGFVRFLAAPDVIRKLDPLADKELKQESPGPYETHPTFRQRAERALHGGSGVFACDSRLEADEPALTLLGNVPAIERNLLGALFPNAKIESLEQIEWDLVGSGMLLPNWRKFSADYPEILSNYRAIDIPDAVAGLSSVAARIADPKGMLLTREQRADRAAALLWTSFAVALVDHGWELHAQPGVLYLSQGRENLAPHDLVLRLRQGILSAEGYRDLVRSLGVAELPL